MVTGLSGLAFDLQLVRQGMLPDFRTGKYAQAYCRISSYLQTLANQGYNPLVAIQLALPGQLYVDRAWVVTLRDY